ncbi:MAG: hypothetical protein ACKVI5_07225 [Nitrospinaceae bacterium]
MHCSLVHIEAFGEPHRLGPVEAFPNMKINTIIVHLSARFLKLYVESSSFWIGQRETVDRIRCYSQIYFAIRMGHA